MTAEEAAVKILDTMLGHLGFPVTIEVQEDDGSPCLQILTGESEYLIGRHGERLDDLQYLVNRTLQKHFPDAPRIRIDCEHYRAMQEDRLIEEVKEAADRVRESGRPFRFRPLNGYYRRLVHNALVDDPEIETISPDTRERLKRIVIQLKGSENNSEEE